MHSSSQTPPGARLDGDVLLDDGADANDCVGDGGLAHKAALADDGINDLWGGVCVVVVWGGKGGGGMVKERAGCKAHAHKCGART